MHSIWYTMHTMQLIVLADIITTKKDKFRQLSLLSHEIDSGIEYSELVN